MANRASLCGILTLLFLLTGFAHAQTRAARKYVMYVGTYTERGSKGIYAFDFTNGKLRSLGLKAEVANPSFLALSTGGQNLYAVSEVGNFQGRHSGGVLAYRTDPGSGALTPLNQTPSIGEGPCHLSLDRTGKFLLVANYDSGSVASFSLQPDGSLGKVAAFVQHLGASVDPDRQKGPHAHFIEATADNRFAIAADLGLDQLVIYKFNPSDGSLIASIPPFAKVHGGEGPRHFVFGPDQKYVYLVTELDSSVSTFAFDAQQGRLQQMQTVSAMPKGYQGKSDAAEIQIDTKGRFLYASTRGPDSIAVFKISPNDGTLTMVQTVPSGGKTPRYFAIDPSGKFLLVGNQESDNIVIFRISSKTGKLLKLGEPTAVISPVSFAFLEAK